MANASRRSSAATGGLAHAIVTGRPGFAAMAANSDDLGRQLTGTLLLVLGLAALGSLSTNMMSEGHQGSRLGVPGESESLAEPGCKAAVLSSLFRLRRMSIARNGLKHAHAVAFGVKE
jgi:hypothetical protein